MVFLEKIMGEIIEVVSWEKESRSDVEKAVENIVVRFDKEGKVYITNKNSKKRQDD